MTLLVIGGVLYVGVVLYALVMRSWYMLAAVHVLLMLVGVMLVLGMNMLADQRAREADASIDTSQPGVEQIEYCRREMYIDPAAVIQPLGFSVQPRGQDKSVFFKFRTGDIDHLFMPGVVDLARLEKGRYTEASPMPVSVPVWWDVDKYSTAMYTLRSGMSGPGDSLDEMTIGVVGEEGDFVVYIHWTDG